VIPARGPAETAFRGGREAGTAAVQPKEDAMADQDERREPAPREDYPGPRETADEDETQPGRTPEMAEQEQARQEAGTAEPA
jgi:hypothetical protein